jgi:hypothetical protein
MGAVAQMRLAFSAILIMYVGKNEGGPVVSTTFAFSACGSQRIDHINRTKHFLPRLVKLSLNHEHRNDLQDQSDDHKEED